MVTPVHEYMVDWGNTGAFGDGADDDITGDVLQSEWFMGRDYASMLTGRSRGGRAIITLDNDSNDGQYNSFNTSSPITGDILPGRKVRIREARGGYSAIVIADSPVGYWRFNESSGAAVDSSGNGNNGTVTGATQNVASLIIESTGAGISFDGASGDVDMGSAAALDNAFNSGGSVEAWVQANTDGEGSTGIVVSKGSWELTIENEANGLMSVTFSASCVITDGIWRTTDLVIITKQPHHIVLTWDSASPTTAPLIYVDGVSVAVTETQTPVGAFNSDAGGALIIGNRAADDLTFDGTIDEPALYSDVLTAVEVLGHYTAGGVIQWTGFLDRINPQVSVSAINTALLEAVGPLAWLARADFMLFLPVATDQDSGSVIGDLLDAVSWGTSTGGLLQSDVRDIDTGKSTIKAYYFRKNGAFGSRDRTVNVTKAMRKVEDTEIGFLHERKNAGIIFENRERRLASPHTVVQDVFSDNPGAGEITYGRITQGDPLKQIFNIFTTNIQNFTVDSVQDIWTHPNATASDADIPTIPAGESVIYVALADDAAVYSTVSVWTTPASSTDYTANAQADGGGADMTSDVGIAVTKTGEVMIITVTNNHATDTMYLTLLKARGQPLKLDNPVLVFAEDATSQAKYGKRQFKVPAELVRDTVEGKDYVEELLSVYKDPRPLVTITVYGNTNDDHMRAMLMRSVSDRISIVATANSTDLGISQDMFIESIRRSVTQNHLSTVVYSCSSVATVAKAWVLGTGILGSTTGLYY